ncbi:MAG: glutathione S-transferase family protein [Deltaproteobacteria bacterium]
MKLYFAPNTRATRPRWMLEELGVPYELEHVKLSEGASHTAEYLAIQPHGQVPALVDGDVTTFESTAICMYLADRFIDRGLAPPFESPLRARYYQWLVYCPATLEPAIGLLTQHTVVLPAEQRVEPIAAKARKRLTESLVVLEGALGSRSFLVGERFSTADLVVAANLRWASRSGLLDGSARLLEYMNAMTSRPAALRAFGA